MQISFKVASLIAAAIGFQVAVRAQDLSPRAYVITPLHSNAITLTYSFYHGGLLFNGAAPITGATGTYSVPVFTYYHSFGIFGHSANVNASLPYAVGIFQGKVVGEHTRLYRSGLFDSSFRLAVNLKGGATMEPKDFVNWKQKTLFGLSLKVIVPTGQYDPTKLINWGANRWAFKPEFGYSQRWGNWVLNGYAGVWFYTTNPQYYSPPIPKPQAREPIGSFEGHLSYDVKPRLWFSLDGNFWFGGATSVHGLSNPDTRQTSSRIGVTGSVPLSKHQSLKFGYSSGTYVRVGGDYENVSVAWQYSWLGKPK